MKKRIGSLSVILPALLIATGCIFLFFKVSSSMDVCPLPDYDSYHGHIEDLLILEGSCVVPTAVEAIQEKSLPKRPFVINFLGHGAYKDAIEVLTTIVEDETDLDRDPALIAVFRIDEELGRSLARRYQAEENELGKYSRDILAGKDYLKERRTYLGALRRYIAITYAL